MNDDSILENTIGQLGGVIKQTGQQVVKTAKDIVEGVPEQVSIKQESASQDNKAIQSSTASDEDTKEVVKGLYAKSDNIQKKTSDQDNTAKKLLQLHQQLHKQTYYDPTFNRPEKQEEERPAEKIEKEKKEKKQMEELQIQEQKKKELPVTVKQGTHEKVPGISG